MITGILHDAFFAAIAGMGFGAVSNPPARSFAYIALLAATGYAFRQALMYIGGVDIVLASLTASLLIGLASLWLGGKVRYPITVLAIPALLPMIPGKLAYNTILAVIMFLQTIDNPQEHSRYLYLLMDNGFLSLTIVFALASGVSVPIALFPRKAYSLTRRKNRVTTS
jgi:uncharacterized membrane protein YjjB (DUF3815 family)